MMTRNTIFVVLITALISGSAWADGMFVAPWGSFMYEPAQQALIEWDEETGTESLSILPSFYGDASSFAWIVPVPSLPEVSAADSRLFWDLADMTRAEYRSRDGDWNCMGSQDDYLVLAGQDDNGVNIIDQELVGYYQTMIISADNASALLDSLSTWGFLNPDNEDQVAEAINDYVERSWYFVTMQIDSTALANIYEPYYYDRYYGGLDPIKLVFAHDEPIYPMKISAYSADDNTNVHIYTKARNRRFFEGAETLYANRFSASEIRSLGYYPRVQALLNEGDFLTKLRKGYTPIQMNDDIILEPAPNNDEYRMIYYSGWPVTTVLLLGAPMVWGVWRNSRRRKN